MKKFLIILLSALLAVTAMAFVACKGDDNKDKDKDRVDLCMFEDYDELITVNWVHSFGRITPMTEGEYKTQGNGYAMLEIDGEPRTFGNSEGNKPMAVIYTSNIGKTDFSDVKTFEIDMYNANDTERTVYLQLETLNVDDAGKATYINTAMYPYVLQPNVKTHVVWEFDRAFLSAFVNLKSVEMVKLCFDPSEGDVLDKYYADNFYLTTTDEPIGTTKVREENELESADREEYLASWYVTMPINCPCAVSFNSDPAFVKAGKGSIKWTAPNQGSINWPTVTFKNNGVTDLSDYYSIVWWMYNDSDNDVEIRNSHDSKSFGYAKSREWTRFEVLVSDFHKFMTMTDDVMWDPANFMGFTPSFTCPENTDITMYIDEIWAYKEPSNPPSIELVEYEPVASGTEVVIKTPDVTRGELTSIVVKAPNGDEVAVTDGKFMPTANGVYTVEYTANNKYDKNTLTVEILVGLPQILQTEVSVYSKESFTYTVKVFETVDTDTLTWKLINAENGTQIDEANASAYGIPDGVYFLDYTATNQYGESTCRVTLVCASSTTPVEQGYSQFYSADKITLTDGMAGVTDDQRYTFGLDYGVLLSQSGASVTLNERVYLGTSLPTDRVLMFYVYNYGKQNLSFIYGMSGETAVSAGAVKVMYVPLQWLELWGATVEENGKYYLKDFTISLSSGEFAAVGGFAVSDSAIVPSIQLEEYSENVTIESDTFTVPAVIGLDYSVSVKEKSTGNPVTVSDYSFAPSAGTYVITYAVTVEWGDFTREIEIDFIDGRGAKFTNYLENKVVSAGGGIKDYVEANKPATTDYTDGATITYDVYYDCANWYDATTQGSNYGADLTTQTFSDAWVYRVKWTVTNEYGSSSYWQYLFVTNDKKQLSATDDTLVLGDNATITDDITVNGENMIKLTGSSSVLLTYDLSLMTDNSFGFFIYNNASTAVTVKINGLANKQLQPQQGSAMNWMVAWGNAHNIIVDGLPKLVITLETTQGDVEVMLGYFYVGSNVTSPVVEKGAPASFNNYLDSKVVSSGVDIKEYVEANKPATTDYTDGATLTYDVYYDGGYWWADTGHGNYGTDLTTQDFDVAWTYRVKWTTTNLTGSETYWQYIFVVNDVKELPATQTTVTLGEYGEFTTDMKVEGSNMIHLTGDTAVQLSYDLSNIGSTNSFGFVVINNSDQKITMAVNGSARELVANQGLVMNEMVAYGNAHSLIVNGNADLAITFTTSDGSPVDVYIGYFYIGESVDVPELA